MAAFFAGSDPIEWTACLNAYAQRREALNSPLLVELDDFWLGLCAAKPTCLTKSQLSKLMQWKLTKGKWRPRLQGFVDALDADQVRSVTQGEKTLSV